MWLHPDIVSKTTILFFESIFRFLYVVGLEVLLNNKIKIIFKIKDDTTNSVATVIELMHNIALHLHF